MSVKKRLVLAFDAFGTLFRPKQSIGTTYAEVAKKHGLQSLPASQLNENFREAFTEAQHAQPNYGKAAQIGVEQWWTNVIEATFAPIIKPNVLPREVVPDLFRLYTTGQGYDRYLDVLPFFMKLRRHRYDLLLRPKADYDIVVGIITNSDERVLPILHGLSLPTSQRRFLPGAGRTPLNKASYNALDFVVLSYDVGAAKPDRRIFEAAKLCAALPDDERDVEHIYLHVGDDVIKDCQAAMQAGWKGACVGGYGRQCRKPKDNNILFLEDLYALDSYIFNDLLGVNCESLDGK